MKVFHFFILHSLKISRVLVLILFFFSCIQKEISKNQTLLKLILPEEKNPVYLFSYPGREVHESKKRYVLEYILSKIKNSKHTIEIYAYSFNNLEIIQELIKARERGVKVSFLLDSEKSYPELDESHFQYRIWKTSGLHHIKAILFDKSSIFLGTGNFSSLGLTHDWNGYIDIPLKYNEYISIQAELEIKKSDFLVKASSFQFLFSPQNGLLIQDKIFQEIEKAQAKVQILSFDHYDSIFSHVLKKASSRGVSIEMVQNRPLDTEGEYLQKEIFFGSSQILEDGNTDRVFRETSNFPEAGLLHHKTILIDSKILLTGSYNFSLSARDKNRELFLFTKEPKAIEEFTKEFERIYNHSYPKKMEFYNHHYNLGTEFDNLNFPKTCYSTQVPSGIWEVGENLFFSYIYFSKASACFEYSKRADISSSLASFSMKTKEKEDLWKVWSFYPRQGNLKYSENPNAYKMPQTRWSSIKVTEEPLFQYLVEAQENLQDLKIYIPDYGFVEPIQFFANNKIVFSIQKEISEALFLWKEKDKLIFSCMVKETPSKKLSFLLGKLFLNSEETEPKECFHF